jgi:hypothetical protein
MNKKIRLLAFITFSLLTFVASAQTTTLTKKKEKKKEFYFSWGYNTEYYTHSNVKIDQPSLGNDFTFEGIKGHDHEGWNNGLFSQAVSIPQYNYRLGLIIDKQKDWGVEINFDHTKFIFADQGAHVKGMLGGRAVDTVINFTQANGFYYYLNNGANFLLFNLVKRWHWYADKSQKVKVDFLAKAGIGPVIPHVEDGFFTNDSTAAYSSTSLVEKGNKPHFQFGGWNVGVEGAIRATFFKYVYLEYTNKIDYARYSNLKIYEGTAKQAFGTYEFILNLGLTFPVGGKVN